MNKLNKRGASIIPLTFTFFLFNLLVFIMISAFAMDGVAVGSKGSYSDSSLDGNVTGSTLDVADVSFFSKYTNTLFNMPWYVHTLLVSINAFMLIIIIAGWVRGV